ncbi:MAG: hypothetical protein ABII82_04685 [Verrucomicrobiota bacterium]
MTELEISITPNRFNLGKEVKKLLHASECRSLALDKCGLLNPVSGPVKMTSNFSEVSSGRDFPV